MYGTKSNVIKSNVSRSIVTISNVSKSNVVYKHADSNPKTGQQGTILFSP
jgi:hypothetical protein